MKREITSSKKYGLWGGILIILTVIVSAIISRTITVSGMFFTVLGHLGFATLISLIPLIFYWLIRKPLNLDEFMATVTAMWLFLAIANLAVM